MLFKVIVAIRQGDDQPWDYSVPPVAEFIDSERAVRFAESEVKSGWNAERVRVVTGRKVVWPKAAKKTRQNECRHEPMGVCKNCDVV